MLEYMYSRWYLLVWLEGVLHLDVLHPLPLLENE
jgi:hypothetical protein